MKPRPPVRVKGRSGLKALLVGAHGRQIAGALPCSGENGWSRTEDERVELFGGAAEVTWKYRCQGCKMTVRVVIE